MFDLPAIQQALQQFGLDGWLLYDFRGSNQLARRIMQLTDDSMGSRRCAYGIPAKGTPVRIVHRIEDSALDHLPGEKQIYLRWQEFEGALESFLNGKDRVAMEYSEKNGNPYISRVDGGTIELVRSFGTEVVSSGDLIQLFEAVWSDEQWKMHQEASVLTNAAFELSWKLIADSVRNGEGVEEKTVCDAIMDHFHSNGMTTYHPPIVARGPHSGLPHYETGMGQETLIRKDDFVLIDLWAKMDRPNSVYSDLTRTGFVGEEVPQNYTKIFEIVAAARDAGIEKVKTAMAAEEPLPGGDVDDAVRNVIENAGYGEFFGHRTGHSIGQEVHGNGAHLDNLETREDRQILPQTCFSIEPGIYLEEFGIRSEVDVFVDAQRQVHVTGGLIQQAVIPILKEY
ncbi:M24 family metallopeptidase [Thalassoglobus polymorphus]|uniref:Xaa-Pro dipeptidase n=1 Tax=Thalassoglobus polymorphus TaxID=2527994 RepID=A0A517QMD3_9PLAN|nr:M24 family metallopeptidase [Thalassoglobus polymorphus]QDT32802.1 Xaa-Pro dipeptidase [Thalassoglobus polymorphus]